MAGTAPLPIARLSMTRSVGTLFRASTGVTPATHAFLDAARQAAQRLCVAYQERSI
jgi:hypothetical protein